MQTAEYVSFTLLFDFAEHIYADTQSLVRTVLDGFNVCVFAYGQTGSGKTYTMVCSYCSNALCHYCIDLFEICVCDKLHTIDVRRVALI